LAKQKKVARSSVREPTYKLTRRDSSTLSHFNPAPLECVWREIPWPFASNNAACR
jgi:hypothetical protein